MIKTSREIAFVGVIYSIAVIMKMPFAYIERVCKNMEIRLFLTSKSVYNLEMHAKINRVLMREILEEKVNGIPSEIGTSG